MFETYADKEGKWRWRLRAMNGEIVIPPESYRDKADAERAIGDAITAMHDSLAEGLTVYEGEEEDADEGLVE